MGLLFFFLSKHLLSQLYDAFYKSGIRFAIGDDVYLKSTEAPFLGRIDRIFRRDKGDVQVLVQVCYKRAKEVAAAAEEDVDLCFS